MPPGAASGKIVFSAEDAKEWAERGEEGGPGPSGDLSRGHRGHEGCSGYPDRPRRHDLSRCRLPAAWQCCVSGCGDIKMDEENKEFELSGKTYREGDWISLNGSTGNIYDGAVHHRCCVGGEFGRVMGWATSSAA